MEEFTVGTPHNPHGWWPRLYLAASLLTALYLLTFPLQDYDTFWHLAYGRAMVETRSFINHEIFSYTAQGKYLGSHSQLAQVILYLLWAVGGANLLLLFKLAVTSLVFMLIVKTAKVCEAGTVAGTTLALAVLIVGMGRIVERPELFSILLQAGLIWLLFRARQTGFPHRLLWVIPPAMVLWDYLHGALYGLVVLCAFVAAEVCRRLLLPKFGISRFVDPSSSFAVKRLLAWFLVTLAAMLAHPNGLLNYEHFWRVGKVGSEYKMYAEWMSPFFAQFYPYWIFLVVVLVAIAICIRHVDAAAIAILVPFIYLSLTYNRAVLAFGLAAVPATAQALGCLWKKARGFRLNHIAISVVGVCLLAGTLVYKQNYVIDNHRFGIGINDTVFPVGSVRFVVDKNLSGNMYNMDAFGGYLAFMVSPERKIFNYNQQGVFTALFDYLHKPATRAQWQISYAIVGNAAEIRAFQQDGFVPVYREPGSMVFARVNEVNAEIIKQYQLYYFNPLLPDKELFIFNKNAQSAEKLLPEMSTYLTYRQDSRIARVFAQLLRESPAVKDDRQRFELLAPAMKYNADSAALLAVHGETFFRRGDLDRAEALFMQSLEREPDNFAARISLGYIYYDRKRFAEAHEHFTALTRNHPDSAEAHYALGLAAFRLCQRQQAKEEFEKFLELAPNSSYAGKAREFLANLAAGCGS